MLSGGAGDEKFRAATRAEVKGRIENAEKDKESGENPIENVGIVNGGETQGDIENKVEQKEDEGEGDFYAKNIK